MQHKGLIGGVILLIIIIFGMFVFVYLEKAEQSVNTIVTNNEQTYGITQITAQHFYNEGIHTLVGEIVFPTPCDLLEWDTTVAESYPEQVKIDFRTVNHSEMCAQIVTTQPFRVDFVASEEAFIRAELNHTRVELILENQTERVLVPDYEPLP